MPEGSTAVRLLHWLPVALLVAVAAIQIVLAKTSDLSPWTGGGFGMFSTTDDPDARHLHVTLVHANVRRAVAVPKALAEEALRARALPTRWRLERLARELARVAAEPRDGQLRSVEIQVWRRQLARGDLRPSTVLLRVHELRFPTS